MTHRIESGWSVDTLGTFTLTVVGNVSTETVSITTGTYCHSDLTSVLGTGNYDDFAGALKTALDASGASSGAFTVTWSTSTLLYTISNAAANFDLTFPNTAAGNRMADALGFTRNTTTSSTAASLSGTRRPYYVIDGAMGGRSGWTRVYEGDDITSQAEAEDGSTYASARSVAPLYDDWTVPFETLAATFELEALTAVPWTWEAFFKHSRGIHPFAVFDDTGNTVHVLRGPRGARFKPARASEDWDGRWSIDLLTINRGALINPPSVLVAPVASGTVEIGQTLSTTDGSWTNSPTSYSYQWQRDGVDISGETSATYTVVAADIGPGTAGIGTGITCLVTANNAAGASSPSASNALVFAHATYLADTAIGISTAGVTLVGSDVDEWASSLGGISVTLTAPSASQRPAYSATGGPGSRPLITGDGTDDVLTGTLTKGSAFDDYEWGGVARLVAHVSAGDRWVAYGVGSVSRFHISERAGGTYRITVSGGANVEPLLDSTTALLHWSGDATPSTINARRTGVVEATASATVTSRSDGETLSVFADGAGTNASNSELMAFYCGPILTSDQRTHLRALLTYHTGVTS